MRCSSIAYSIFSSLPFLSLPSPPPIHIATTVGSAAPGWCRHVPPPFIFTSDHTIRARSDHSHSQMVSFTFVAFPTQIPPYPTVLRGSRCHTFDWPTNFSPSLAPPVVPFPFSVGCRPTPPSYVARHTFDWPTTTRPLSIHTSSPSPRQNTFLSRLFRRLSRSLVG